MFTPVIYFNEFVFLNRMVMLTCVICMNELTITYMYLLAGVAHLYLPRTKVCGR